MSVMDFELQRERRVELLRQAESRRLSRSGRARNRRKRARGFWKLAGAWVIGR